MILSSFSSIQMAFIWLLAIQVLAPEEIDPKRYVDKHPGVLAKPEWIPCIRDPNRQKLKHCSEEYKLCREAGGDSTSCLARDYPVLIPARTPSKDEYMACQSAGHSSARCKKILEEAEKQ